MVYSYYPGCTLKNKAKDLDECARLSAEKIGFTLSEIPDWQCCGGTYPLSKDEIATKLSSIRALVAARDAGNDLVTICSACHNVIKQVNNDMATNDDICLRANNYLKLDNPYHGETKVYHYLEVLRDIVGFDKLAKLVEKPLKGKKIGAYYGCLLLRPSAVMKFDDSENPSIIEDFIKALGGEPIIYSQRNECCGAYSTLEDKSITDRRCKTIIADAADHGADYLITACPLCQYNLLQCHSDRKIFYFTQLLAHALGVKDLKED